MANEPSLFSRMFGRPPGRLGGIIMARANQAMAGNREAIGSGRVRLQLGFADRLPLADASFDKALAINAMHHWPDRPRW